MKISRRSLIAAAIAAVIVAGAGGWYLTSAGPSRAEADIVVYKSPWCGCCGSWVEHLRRNGFSVAVEEREDMDPIKERYGVSPRHQSCHTARVDGYTIEGHVPAREIKRLLTERPQAQGLAVPGMPIGSPGMEQDGQRDRYAVILWGDQGSQVFAKY
ncbi:MAG: DUF411 domain-containing protein [Alphaproteobacteria bacterium]|jgi:hypothetical protein|nr:DUF411 domain-containing protein [Alphaproteobacteria bacterium]HJP22769.1 DUF411 domain-containing protein [Alphaproteobacteria bacterium]